MENINNELNDYLDNLDAEKQKSIQDYLTYDESEKQEYWNTYIFRAWWYDERGTSLPINVNELKKEYEGVEDDFDRFLPGIKKALEEEGFTGEINDIFLFENDSNFLDKVMKSDVKNDYIEGLDMSFEELAKKIGDLFYEPLASILNSISIELDKQIDSNDEVIKLLKEASDHSLRAWDHCKPYVTDINELEKNSKHTFDIEGTNLSNEELSRSIAYLENSKLKEFLELLSVKMNIDGVADEGRKRLKLAGELYNVSEKLKQASELI